jgi:hypothetical protein
MRDIGKSNLTSRLLLAASMAALKQEKTQGIEASGAVVDEATRFAPSPEKMLGEALTQEQIAERNAVFKETEEKYAGFEERMAKRRERSLEEQAEMKAVRDQDFQHLTRLPNVKKGEIVDLAVSEEVLDMLMDFRNYPDYSDESLASWVMTFTEEHEQQKPRLLTSLMFRHASRMLGTVGLLNPAERHHMMWSVISVFMTHLTEYVFKLFPLHFQNLFYCSTVFPVVVVSAGFGVIVNFPGVFGYICIYVFPSFTVISVPSS